MPNDFAYMTSAKNLKSMFERFQGAGTPPKFTLEFLKTLGYTSSTDRPVIGVLKALNFVRSDGAPTERYNAYRNAVSGGAALADGLKEGWAAVFLADQQAHKKTSTELTGLLKSVSGEGEASVRKMATTFKVLCEMADWSIKPADPANDAGSGISTQADIGVAGGKDNAASDGKGSSGLSGEVGGLLTGSLNLHHDVHIHLPATSDVPVYTAIFRALKAELLDSRWGSGVVVSSAIDSGTRGSAGE